MKTGAYGKTIENLRKNNQCQISQPKDYLKYVSKPNFRSQKKFCCYS